jgi:capsular exopolysaccharide synthesis family protein
MQSPRLAAALRRRWLWPVLGLVIGGVAGLLFSLVVTPTYSSHTQFLIAANNATSTTDAYQGSQLALQQVPSYEELFSGERLASSVIDELRSDLTPDQFIEKVTVDAPDGTALLDVTVTDSSPEQAQRIAEALGDQFMQLIDVLDRAAGGGATQVLRTQEANLPSSPDQPQPVRNTVLGCLIGLLIGGTVSVIRARLDDSVQDADQLVETSAVAILGVIPRHRRVRRRGVVVREAHEVAEAYRRLGNNLVPRHADEPPRIILVSGARPAEGRTALVANVAIALARAGQRVAVVDADLRRPGLSSLLGLRTEPGLTDVVAGTMELRLALQTTENGRLLFLASGSPVDKPDEVLAATTLVEVLEALRSTCSVVLVDAPALLRAADAGDIARLADGVLLVVRHHRTTVDEVQTCLASLDRMGAVTLGAVITFVPPGLPAPWGDHVTVRGHQWSPTGAGATTSGPELQTAHSASATGHDNQL